MTLSMAAGLKCMYRYVVERSSWPARSWIARAGARRIARCERNVCRSRAPFRIAEVHGEASVWTVTHERNARARIAIMSSKTLDEHIELTPDTAGGRPRIRGRRITVQDIAIWHERLGKSADEIASDYHLSLADVHAALAYYFDHREEIDARMTEDRAFAEALRARTPSKRDQKLRSLRGED